MKKIKILLCVFFLNLGSHVFCKNENITVIGIGKLGICAALCFERAGFNVLGVDINEGYVKQINDKSFVSFEPQVSDYLKKSKNFKATCSLDEGIDFADIYFIYVNTPGISYDHKNLNMVLSAINRKRVENKHIIVCCTVFPGYISNDGKSLIKDCKNTTLSYNPEFIVQGDIIKGFTHPSMVLIGQESLEAGDIVEDIYKCVCQNDAIIYRMNTISAEITKLALNCFITTKIAFANAIADVADSSSGADKYNILHAIGCDGRINEKCLKPGYGYGGPCFPRDNRALNAYAKSIGIDLLISQATDESNKQHTQFMIDQFFKKNKNKHIIMNGVTYKANCSVPIIEESQKLLVAVGLAKRGKQVVIKDKEEVISLVRKQYGNLFEYKIIS